MTKYRWFLLSILMLPVVSAPLLLQAKPIDSALYSGLQWRLIGPFRAGRVVAVAGVPGQPNHFYFGSVGGGVWETVNAGRTWNPIFDKEPVASIGAIAVAPSDPNVIYVGSGETDIRSSFSTGNGMYKSTDAGKTWTHIGLVDTNQIGSVLVNPKDPNIVYVAALGHGYAANPERGVFKSKDGGQTWKKVLYKNADTGAVDLAFGGDSQTIYAALWQTRRPPWSVYPPSDGPGSGLYKSTDGGESWTAVTGHGFPSSGLGRIGLAVAPSNPQVVYANVAAKEGEGGLYRSDDGGNNWTHVTGDSRIWARWWYFGGVTVDPKNPDVVYIMNTAAYKSTDGGRSFLPFKGAPGGDDYHTAWVDPDNSEHMVLGVDQGTTITLDGGKTWSSWYNQPTGQFYHVATDNQFPYNVYGAQQDSLSVKLPSRTDYGDYTDGISAMDFLPIPTGGESGYIAPDPLNSRYIFGPAIVRPFNGDVTRFDTLSKQLEDVSPTLEYPGITYRKTWTLPVTFSQIDPHVMYSSHQMIFRTDNGGQSWSMISPDLTRENPGVPSTLDPITARDTVIEGPRRGVIYTIAPSPIQKGEIWAGTDDGQIWVTHNEGEHWRNVTPKGLSAWSKVGIVEASHFDAKTAYAAVDRHRLDDYKPYIYVTHDAGKSWTLAIKGIADGDFVNVVREDPKKAGLLYAGTEKHVYVSFDAGANWQSLQQNLPVTSMRDIDVHGDDLVLATFGRGFWILDDVTALRQLDGSVSQSAATLFKPAVAYRVRPGGFLSTPFPKDEPQAHNPPNGALIDYYLKTDASSPVTLEITDAKGKSVQSFSSADTPPKLDLQTMPITPDWTPRVVTLSNRAGMHRFVWNLHYALPEALMGNGMYRFENGDGLWALPGNYTVRLTVGGQSWSQPLEIKEDPRLQISEAALQAQYDLGWHIESERMKIAGVSAQARKLRAQLRKVRGNASGNLARKIDAVIKQVDEVAGVKPEDNPANSVGLPTTDFVSLLYLQDAYANLAASVESADAAPSRGKTETLAKYQKILDSALARWQRLRTADLQHLNGELKSAGLAQVDVPADAND
ncbi:hypothetical protein [Rhodanobacter sp. T12-5]|uniref:WD40/YVTN/BNR-like repeat-containing protein n=1 Tax=Rhodanobacter sp. T12-5 TaxID=2024611 RepID=UPI0018D7B8D5|nr:hypothetical protein [Rhodanobacter sp. T12-5]